MAKEIACLDDAITAFIEGAILHHGGTPADGYKIATRGLRRTSEGAAFIDKYSPNARDVLIPLLDHDDEGVRVTAASALIQSRPDLALPVLHDVSDTGVTEAHMTAGLILIHKQVFGDYVMGVYPPDPRFPIPEAKEQKHNAAG